MNRFDLPHSDPRPHRPKSKPVKDPEVLAEFHRRNWWCALCGAESFGLHTLTAHHISDGGARSDEPCNLLMLGWEPCHRLDKEAMHGYFTIRGGPIDMPILTLGQQLYLKRRANPKDFDPERLAVLIGKPMPEPESPPAWAEALFRRNRPELFQ
jgi:hypothetical protein